MRPAHLALAALVAAVWGVNFVVIEIGLDHFPPLLFSALRFLAAALPAVFLVGRPTVAWKWILAVGLVLGVAKFGLLFTGMDLGAPAGLSSLVLQVQAVFTALFAFAALGERPGRLKVAGMGVALAGIGVAAADEGGAGSLAGFALVIAAAACWGVSNVLTRKASPPDALNFMVWVSTVPVLPLLALSLLLEGPERDLAALRALDWTGAGVILYVAWVTTVFGFGAWGWLLRRHPARPSPLLPPRPRLRHVLGGALPRRGREPGPLVRGGAPGRRSGPDLLRAGPPGTRELPGARRARGRIVDRPHQRGKARMTFENITVDAPGPPPAPCCWPGFPAAASRPSRPPSRPASTAPPTSRWTGSRN